MTEMRIPTPWRRLAIVSALTLLLVIVAWNAAAFAIDSSDLEQGPDSFGMTFGSFIGSVIYGGLPLILAFVAASIAAFGSPRTARVCAWIGAGLCLLCAAGLVVVAGLTVTGTAAEVAFGAVSFLLALVLAVPLVLCIRRRRSEGSEAAQNPGAGRSTLS